jgi:hypothetical protein
VGGWHDLHPAGALQGPQRGRKTDTHPYANHHRAAHERTDHNGTDHDGTDHNSTDHDGTDHNSTDHDGANHNSTDHDGPNHDRANDDPAVADVDASEWIVAELTSGKDLRQYVTAERTGKRPCWCNRCSRR